jgi:hypothetical protein
MLLPSPASSFHIPLCSSWPPTRREHFRRTKRANAVPKVWFDPASGTAARGEGGLAPRTLTQSKWIGTNSISAPTPWPTLRDLATSFGTWWLSPCQGFCPPRAGCVHLATSRTAPLHSSIGPSTETVGARLYHCANTVQTHQGPRARALLWLVSLWIVAKARNAAGLSE